MSTYRNITRFKQELSREECEKILVATKRGVLSVIAPEGYPYGMPMNHFYDPYTNEIYFHGGKMGHKIDALKKNNKASFCVIDDGYGTEGWWLQFKSVIVFGVIEMIDDPVIVEDISRRLSAKFVDDKEYIDHEIELSLKGTLLLKMRIEHMTGKKVNER